MDLRIIESLRFQFCAMDVEINDVLTEGAPSQFAAFEQLYGVAERFWERNQFWIGVGIAAIILATIQSFFNARHSRGEHQRNDAEDEKEHLALAAPVHAATARFLAAGRLAAGRARSGRRKRPV